jgi:hypothetical protein
MAIWACASMGMTRPKNDRLPIQTYRVGGQKQSYDFPNTKFSTSTKIQVQVNRQRLDPDSYRSSRMGQEAIDWQVKS